MSAPPIIERVLVSVDFDEASASALTLAGALAAAWGAELTMFHSTTVDMPAYFTAAQIDALEAERQESRVVLASRLGTLADPPLTVTTDLTIGEGPPQEAVLRMAAAFDLVALGTHRRHGPQRWWLGSVAEAVVRGSPRPVLVVPAGARVSQAEPTILAVGGAAVEGWAEALRSALHGRVVRSADLQHCDPARLPQADVLVLPRPPELGEIAHLLKECTHPVLFVPRETHVERRVS